MKITSHISTCSPIFGVTAVVGFGVPLRHLFEGPVWYIYINLVIFTGMILGKG